MRLILALGIAFGVAGFAIGQPSTDLSTAGVVPFRTPYKYGRLVLENSDVPGAFDSKGVDGAFVGSIDGKFYMTYIGFDGVGYQTGLATSNDLVHWTKEGLILARDPE